MNSSEIRTLAAKLQIKDFLGTFAIDQLRHIDSKTLGTLIFNTDLAKEWGTHWIAIQITKKNLHIFDPVGYQNFNLSSDHLNKFLLKFKQHVFINRIQIQTYISDKFRNLQKK